MEKQLRDFLFSPYSRRRWLNTPQMSVYVRKNGHLGSDNEIHAFLDIANVTVQPEHRRQGCFSAFLALCQQLSPYDGLYIENVHSEILRAYLRRLALADPRWHERGIHFLWEREPQEQSSGDRLTTSH